MNGHEGRAFDYCVPLGNSGWSRDIEPYGRVAYVYLHRASLRQALGGTTTLDLTGSIRQRIAD